MSEMGSLSTPVKLRWDLLSTVSKMGWDQKSSLAKLDWNKSPPMSKMAWDQLSVGLIVIQSSGMQELT